MNMCPNCGCHLVRFTPRTYGNVAIDELGAVTFEGFRIDLTRCLQDLVVALIRAEGRGLTRSTLANLLEGEVNDETVTKYVERARSRFRAIDPEFDQIASLRGFGAYRWEQRGADPLRHAKPSREAGLARLH